MNIHSINADVNLIERNINEKASPFMYHAEKRGFMLYVTQLYVVFCTLTRDNALRGYVLHTRTCCAVML